MRNVLGGFEPVVFPEWGGMTAIAKVDTGAFSGALHCSDIELSPDGETLSFYPMEQREHIVKTKRFTKRMVRSASGHESLRYLVPVMISLKGEMYEVTIGLASRSNMKYEILIGRRFLREQKMLVDVTLNGEYDDEWKRGDL